MLREYRGLSVLGPSLLSPYAKIETGTENRVFPPLSPYISPSYQDQTNQDPEL